MQTNRQSLMSNEMTSRRAVGDKARTSRASISKSLFQGKNVNESTSFISPQQVRSTAALTRSRARTEQVPKANKLDQSIVNFFYHFSARINLAFMYFVFVH